jgi:hypothetical protein
MRKRLSMGGIFAQFFVKRGGIRPKACLVLWRPAFMALFAKAYARQLPPSASPLPVASERAESACRPPQRVRVVQGVLAGLTGQVLSSIDSERWLVEADQGPFLLRINPRMLELLPLA